MPAPEFTVNRKGYDPYEYFKFRVMWDGKYVAGVSKDIIIGLYNEAGQKVLAYKVYRCWVSEYTALPDLDASGNVVAIQSIKLENEGWERDTEVSEPE